MRPLSYTDTDGCHSCQLVFAMLEWDAPPAYYCTYGDDEPRPKCGSVLMKESFFHNAPDDAAYTLMGKWEAWAQNRFVFAWGTCIHYQKTPTGAPGSTNLEQGD